jgi:hypothetical protein
MNLHEQIDRFLNKTPRFKVGIALLVLAVIIFSYLIVYKAGKSSGYSEGENYARTEITEKQKKTDQIIADSSIRESILRAEGEQLAVQNEILRAQTEAQAEILKANDVRIAGNAKKLNQIFEERKKTYENIDASPDDIHFQRRAVCRDALRAGFRLSDAFCNSASSGGNDRGNAAGFEGNP